MKSNAQRAFPKKLPFTISREAKRRLKWSKMHDWDGDVAFHIATSAISMGMSNKREKLSEEIHIVGYTQGALPRTWFYTIAGLHIAIGPKVMKRIKGRELVMVKGRYKDGTLRIYLWMK